MHNKPVDAVSFLVNEHREVTALFKKFEGLSQRAVVSKKKIANQICDLLTVHTQVEEDIFYPAVRTALPIDDLIDEAIVEHASAKDLITQIQHMDVNDDLYDAKVKVLAEQTEHHIREEEKDIFPRVRKSRLDLITLAAQMHDRKEEREIALHANPLATPFVNLAKTVMQKF